MPLTLLMLPFACNRSAQDNLHGCQNLKLLHCYFWFQVQIQHSTSIATSENLEMQSTFLKLVTTLRVHGKPTAKLLESK
jgi:hypothetical protein